MSEQEMVVRLILACMLCFATGCSIGATSVRHKHRMDEIRRMMNRKG